MTYQQFLESEVGVDPSRENFFNTGKVYFATDHNGLVKIGWVERGMWARLKQLQTGNASEIGLIAWLEGPRSWESYIHKKLKKSHVRGEWFTWDDDVSDFMREHCQWIYAGPDEYRPDCWYHPSEAYLEQHMTMTFC